MIVAADRRVLRPPAAVLGELPSADEPPFDRRLDPGGVVIGREGDFAFPRCCILGEGLFKRWPVVFGP